MGDEANAGPDFSLGVDPISVVADRPLRGHVAGKAAIMARAGDEFFVVGAECTHYHAPLEDGLVVGATVRCPWHHACFSLRSGRALRAPAFDALKRWRVEKANGKVYARERLEPASAQSAKGDAPPRSVLIVGGGAAGFACAERPRAEGYDGFIDLVSGDPAEPYDRPNLSKEYLAGEARPEWLPLRESGWYRDNGVRLKLGRRVETLDTTNKSATLDDASTLSYDALLLATGASPVKPPIPGADLPHVFYLRSLADSDRIIAAAKNARRALVIGASFIGLEVAAALRTRGLEVHVVAPEAVPMARILGPKIGAFVKALHEQKGANFHLEDSVVEIGEKAATLKSGATIEADIVVIGVGVRPNIALAEAAGLKVDKGVIVDEYLQTSAPGVYAAGDIAVWPDKITGGRIRVEHWVVAERQGQTAALNMLGRKVAFDAAPFFWSRHYDHTISYSGHAAGFDRTEIDGDPA
ncbi:MAG: FAD-dependent oxidoreductase, partial [Methylocystis sp.]|nr:FAD-dependent oxidoreductase [Methylocystis sp.]